VDPQQDKARAAAGFVEQLRLEAISAG